MAIGFRVYNMVVEPSLTNGSRVVEGCVDIEHFITLTAVLAFDSFIKQIFSTKPLSLSHLPLDSNKR